MEGEREVCTRRYNREDLEIDKKKRRGEERREEERRGKRLGVDVDFVRYL